jgi:hypothetical protein
LLLLVRVDVGFCFVLFGAPALRGRVYIPYIHTTYLSQEQVNRLARTLLHQVPEFIAKSRTMQSEMTKPNTLTCTQWIRNERKRKKNPKPNLFSIHNPPNIPHPLTKSHQKHQHTCQIPFNVSGVVEAVGAGRHSIEHICNGHRLGIGLDRGVGRWCCGIRSRPCCVR